MGMQVSPSLYRRSSGFFFHLVFFSAARGTLALSAGTAGVAGGLSGGYISLQYIPIYDHANKEVETK